MLLVCLLCPLAMSSQTSVLSHVKFCHEKVPPLNSRSHQKWWCHFSCSCIAAKFNPWKAELILSPIFIINPSKQMFVNLQFYLHIELYSQYWIHTKACTTNQLFLPFWECITSTFQHFMEIDPPPNYHNMNISWYEEKKIISAMHIFISSAVSLRSNKPLNRNLISTCVRKSCTHSSFPGLLPSGDQFSVCTIQFFQFFMEGRTEYHITYHLSWGTKF